jgi:hypothetical protein
VFIFAFIHVLFIIILSYVYIYVCVCVLMFDYICISYICVPCVYTHNCVELLLDFESTKPTPRPGDTLLLGL